jgi:hypothetical protein
MFGYGKQKKYESFPFDWLKPGEAKWNFKQSTSGNWSKPLNGNWKYEQNNPSTSSGFISNDLVYKKNWLKAFIRRYILRKKPCFWHD